jgi:hypothetical protein
MKRGDESVTTREQEVSVRGVTNSNSQSYFFWEMMERPRATFFWQQHVCVKKSEGRVRRGDFDIWLVRLETLDFFYQECTLYDFNY